MKNYQHLKRNILKYGLAPLEWNLLVSDEIAVLINKLDPEIKIKGHWKETEQGIADWVYLDLAF